MASACVNNVSVSAYGRFNPRAASFTREDARSSGSEKKLIPPPKVSTEEEEGFEFEFRHEVPVGMLTADELFSDGKLVTAAAEVETEVSGEESCLVSSPKAPRCSSKWRELLGFKRFSQNSKTTATTTFHSNPPRSSTASFKQFLNRTSKTSSSSEASSLITLPLLSDSESLSSRMSLSSSSSSSHDHEDTTPRLSLDAERLNHLANQTITANPFAPARPRMRLLKPRDGEESVSVDSPRLNSSGKIVYQKSLERSSSSPSGGGTSGGGYRNRGVERSYSVNVRVAPVLNVPVCSVRGGSVIFSQFFSSSSQHKHGGISRGRNSTDRVS